MAAESSKRSKLIDVTYQQLQLLLSGYDAGATPEQTQEMLEARIDTLKDFRKPFGKPNADSRKRVDSGSVTLRDGILVRVEPADKDYIFAISTRFNIDEVEALVLFRSFLYNEGNILQDVDSKNDDALVQQVVDAFSPFYHSERRCLARLLVPIFRAQEHESSFFNEQATTILPQIIPDGPAFVQDVLADYQDKTRAPVDEASSNDPRLASRWAKENLRDQLVLLEVLFWAMWSFVPRQGPIVVKLYETAYETNLGSVQRNGTLLLDQEGGRLQQDCAAVWLLLMIEVLELETFSDNGNPDVTGAPSTEGMYTAHPDSLKRIHQLVTSHGDSNFAPVYLAWTLIVARLEAAVVGLDECPPAYRSFLDSLDVHSGRPYSRNREPIHTLMLQRSLDPSVGLFGLLRSLLTSMPLFVTSIAWKTDSSISEPNAVAYRSVIKGLLIALSELVPVELIPDFDSFVDVWVALLGQSESQSVIGLCQQFWQYDATKSKARRAILDVVRSRFPVQFTPLLQLLGALTGSGFRDADPLSSVDHRQQDHSLVEARAQCAQEVSYFFENLPTYTQVIPASACIGSQALYEKVPERYGSSSKALGPAYTNLRPLKLPGGSLLPARSTGRLLSQDGEDFVIVSWQHEHSGWKLLVEVLFDYVRRRRLSPGLSTSTTHPPIMSRTTSQPPAILRLEDVGIELDPEGDSSVVADALDLLRTVISDNQILAAQVLSSLENDDQVQAMTGGETPDLVQLTMLILEDALMRSARQRPGTPLQSALITSAMGLLAGLLSLPAYAPRVWLFARASTALFDSSRSRGAMAAERALGAYATTQALLRLVHALWTEASGTLLAPREGRARLLEIKEEVLLRALRFVHAEVWVEHAGWKYAQLGTRFEVGRLASGLYGDILEQTPPDAAGPLVRVSQAVCEALVAKATSASIGPLISAITTSGAVFRRIHASRRLSDLRGLYLVLRSHLRLARLCIVFKQRMYADAGPCLLEQALCSRAGSDSGSFSGGRHKADPLDVLASFVEDSNAESLVPLESIRLLYALCSSLSTSQFSAPSMVGHLSDPEATVAALVGVARHPYHDLDVRLGVWRFMALAAEKEPALGHLFVAGQFRASKGKAPEEKGKGKRISALRAAREMLASWSDYWETNPQLLASILGFLVAVWQRGWEHQLLLEDIRKDIDFWTQLAGLIKEDMSPAPEYQSTEYIDNGAFPRSSLHEGISLHSYRILARAFAIRIIALDIDLDPAPSSGTEPRRKPDSYLSVETIFKSEDQFAEQLHDAIFNAYDPALYPHFTEKAGGYFPDLALEHFESRDLSGEREFGDDFSFATPVLQMRMDISNAEATDDTVARGDELIHNLFSINLNLSLAYASTQLGQSWQTLLVKIAPFVQGNAASRPLVLSLAASISSSIAAEKRSGDVMLTAHGVRLAILLALLELAWFSGSTLQNEKQEVASFMKVVASVHDIVVSEWQSPMDSIRGATNAPFHRTLLQIIYFCATECRGLTRRSKSLNAEHRLDSSSMINATLIFVIDALRFVFDAARTRLDADLDTDMQLLIAAFEQCTRPDINPSTSLWLTRCQETSVLQSSMELFVQTDLSGLSTLQHTRARKQALYAPHILTFHIAFASIQSSAERLASERVLVAYSNSSMAMAISSGKVDVTLPELPGERSPAHWAYCVMLSIVSGVISALGWQKHFFDAEASGFIRLCGNQITRALSWSIGDPLTLPLVEEMERVANLFHSIASSAPAEGYRNETTQEILSAFSTNALLLLQQLNYALSHPNHLTSLLEPVTPDERAQLERDGRSQPPQTAGAEIVDPVARPFLARLVHRLHNLTSNIVCTLIAISSAEDVLRGSSYLPPRSALVVPHSKAVLGEPASMGTLLELASGTLDTLGHLVARPAGQALTLTTPGRASERALDVRAAARAARRALEAVLFYATTQLGAWVAAPDAPEAGGLASEVSGELRAVLEKARGVLARSQQTAGEKPGATVDITEVLLGFLNQRVIGNA